MPRCGELKNLTPVCRKCLCAHGYSLVAVPLGRLPITLGCHGAQRPVDMHSLDRVLSGRIVVCEVASDVAGKRRWLQLQLQDVSRPSYPLRTPPNAMLGLAAFWPSVAKENARFKLRTSDFDAEDVASGMDPSYDGVGEYVEFESYADLVAWLRIQGVCLEEFVDSAGTDYPL